MNEFESLRDDTLAAYEQVVALLATRLEDTRKRLLAESRDRLAGGQVYVVAAGEFKRGKSSLLSAVIGRPGLFPDNADIATCAVVRLRWGARERAQVIFAETVPGDPASAPPAKDVDIDMIGDFITEQGNPGNVKNVLRIEMEAPVDQLRTGLAVGDTPGIGGITPSHTAATRAELRYADAILFVASALEPLSTAELAFLKSAIAKCPIVVTAVTMIDKVVDPAPIVTEARSRIAAATGLDPAGLVVVAVSSFRKFDAIDENDDALLAESGFPQLEAELWGGLAMTCGAAQVRTALTTMYPALAEALAPIDNDLAGLCGDGTKVKAELLAEQKKFQQLKSDGAAWKRDLQEDVDHAVRPIQRQLVTDLNDVRDEFRRALSRPETVDEPNRIIEAASDGLMSAAERASDGLERAFERVADKYAAVTELSLTMSGVSPDPIRAGLSVSAPEKGMEKSGYMRFRESWMGALAGAGAGALIGTAVPIVGNIIGGVAGFVVGLFGGNKYHVRITQDRQRKTYIAELREVVAPKLDAGRSQVQHEIADQATDYSRALTRRLEHEIVARGDSLAASIRALEATAKQDTTARADKERDLKGQRQELATLRATLDHLGGRADDLARRAGRPHGEPAGATAGQPV